MERKVAFVLAQDFEDSEFTHPYDAVKEAGHGAVVIGTEAGKELTGKQGEARTTTDVSIDQVSADEFDALVIPGGYSPDKLRLDDGMVKFVRQMMTSGKPVAAICHAGQLLCEADVVDGKRLTSWPSVRNELELAGAEWVDEECVVDDNLITSRNPGDLDAFSSTLVEHLS